jgi:hypothetical protein
MIEVKKRRSNVMRRGLPELGKQCTCNDVEALGIEFQVGRLDPRCGRPWSL